MCRQISGQTNRKEKWWGDCGDQRALPSSQRPGHKMLVEGPRGRKKGRAWVKRALSVRHQNPLFTVQASNNPTSLGCCENQHPYYVWVRNTAQSFLAARVKRKSCSVLYYP